MRFRIFAAFAFVLFLVGLGLVLLLPQNDPQLEPDSLATTHEKKPPMDAFLSYTPAPMRPASGASADNSIPLPAASEHAIPNEYTLFFENEADLRAFVSRSGDHSLNILGVIPQLLAVRISGQASNVSPLLKEGMTVDNNYRMRVPTIPDEDLWQAGELTAFNAHVLDFLEAPTNEDRLSWGNGVKIAVLDTGWTPHPSMEGTQVVSLDILGEEAAGGFTGHGTAVLGLIGSTDPLAPGIAPGSELLSIRVLDGQGMGDAFSLAQGILLAVDSGANVINMSLGGYGDSQILRKAVSYALERNVVLVASSGNDGVSTPTYPAAYPNVIGVSAVDASGNRAPFSNYGSGVDVAAPGFQINAIWEDDSYVLFNGTSASAPLVSGMAARILQNGYATTPDAVQSMLRDYANDTGYPGDDPQYGAGLLNAARIEESVIRGLYDVALADFYPAIEESDGTTFPLYATIQNRGTEFLPVVSAEININGSPSYYRIPGLLPGQVKSVKIPISLRTLESGSGFRVLAQTSLPERYEDLKPANDSGEINFSSLPPSDEQ